MNKAKTPLRILWKSNSPHSPTGYGNQTKLFVKRLQAAGHQMGIFAFYGVQGAPLKMKDIWIYPPRYHPYGQDVAGAHAENFKADILLSLMDAWVCEPHLYGGAPWVPWFPVDSEPLPPPVLEKVDEAHARIVYSRFGEQMVREAGLDCYYVPHGVDTSVFRPLDSTEAREKLGWPKDRFIVGMVAANKGNPSRKAFTENIAAFAELKKKHPDAFLYLHTTTDDSGQQQGVNLPEFLNYLGLIPKRDYAFADQYKLANSFPDEYMANAYSAMDVHLLVSMGEGFGIPILEAQACGTPVITGDWTAMPELTFSGWKVPKEEADYYWIPLAAKQYKPRVGAIVEALEAAYSRARHPNMRKAARKGALPYDADKVTEKYWLPVLEQIAESLEDVKRERRWAKVGVSSRGSLRIPSLEPGDPAQRRIYPDKRQMVFPGGFEMSHNGVTLDIEDDPEGSVAKVIMAEIRHNYDLDLDYQPGDVVLDIGAHVGVVSCYLGKKYPDITIYAYEPNPTNFQRLQRNLEANGVSNVHAIGGAVTADGRHVTIGDELNANSGGNSIYGEQGQQAASTTLAKIIEESGAERIRLLKLDCEGAEYEIIESNPEVLERVDAIRGELHPMPGKSMSKLDELMEQYVPDVKVVYLGGKDG